MVLQDALDAGIKKGEAVSGFTFLGLTNETHSLVNNFVAYKATMLSACGPF